MTPQEQQLLNSLTERVNQTQLQEKDPEAEALLNRELSANPDALYILAQTVLIQDIALNQAKAQVAQLQQQVQHARQPAHGTSFLGRLLGERDPEPAPPQPQQASYQTVPQYSQPAQGQFVQPAPPPYTQQQYQQPQYMPVQSGQPSFLRGAMQTAAGVAAGALAFEGVESILHGLGGDGGWGGAGMGMGSGFERPIEENVVNNYYGQPGSQGFEHERSDAGGAEHHLHDQTADQGAAQFSDAGYDTSASNDTTTNEDSEGNDLAGFDDGGSDASSAFDGGGQDDGGIGFDDGGGFGGDSSDSSLL